MKTFHLLKGLYNGGVENLIMNWYRHIDHTQFNFDFGVTTLEAQEFVEEIKQYGGHILWISKGTSVWQKLSYLYRLYKTLKQHGPYTSFFSHEQFFGPLTCVAAWAAGIKKRVTVAHWVEDYHTPYSIKIFSFLCSRLFVTHRLAVSTAAGQVQFGNLPFSLIHTGIDTQRFAFNSTVRKHVRQQLNLYPKAFVVGNVSRLSADKNLFFLLDVFALIRRQVPNAVLLQCGGGILEKKLKTYVKQKKLEDCVCFMGNVPDTYRYYQAMDCFVFPSFNEGLGIVAVEAQCSGLPCFISDGVPKEAIIFNTTQIPLSKSASQWANIILNKTKNFIRHDQSTQIKQAGFDVCDTARQLQEEYLK